MPSLLRNQLTIEDYVPYRQITADNPYLLYILNVLEGNRRIRITSTLGTELVSIGIPDHPNLTEVNNPTLTLDSIENELRACLESNPVPIEDPITCSGALSDSNCFKLLGLHDLYIDNVRRLQNATVAQIVGYFDSEIEDMIVELCPQCDAPLVGPMLFSQIVGEWDWYINGVIYKSGNVDDWNVEPLDTYEFFFTGADVNLPEDFWNIYSIVPTENPLLQIGRATNILVPKNSLSSYALHELMDSSAISYHSNGALSWCAEPEIGEIGECSSGGSFVWINFPLMGGNDSIGTFTLMRPDIPLQSFTYNVNTGLAEFAALVNAFNIPSIHARAFELGGLVQIVNSHPTLNATFYMDQVRPNSEINGTGNDSTVFDEFGGFSGCLMPDLSDTLEGLKFKIVNNSEETSHRVRLTPKANALSVIYGLVNPTHGYLDGDMVMCLSPSSVEEGCQATTLLIDFPAIGGVPLCLSYRLNDGDVVTVYGQSSLDLYENLGESLRVGALESPFQFSYLELTGYVLGVSGYQLIGQIPDESETGEWISRDPTNPDEGEFVTYPCAVFTAIPNGYSIEFLPTPVVPINTIDMVANASPGQYIAHSCGNFLNT